MSKQLLMGNEAIALGAIRAGVGVVTGYAGTPSTEVIENIVKYNDGSIYVEWSVNEKSALEIAAGAAYAGQRTLVTMKQVGLNVASDPLMSLSYVGIKGGMVVFVADDPGPISSQTEQDTRKFAEFSKLPLFDPESPEEAYLMIGDAFAFSEEHHTPVIFRSSTRICHACAAIEPDTTRVKVKPEGFIKDSKWVIFPRLSYQAHKAIEARNAALRDTLSSYHYNTLSGSGTRGIVTGGVSGAYAKEALSMLHADSGYKYMKIATPHPFPETLALQFLDGLSEVLVLEELDPVIEKELIFICGKHHLNVTVHGKLDGTTPNAGENSADNLRPILASFLQIADSTTVTRPAPPALPVRPPVLCAGCPHRASFYAVKQAMKGRKAFFGGDIGCYTLGNASPLNMVDTCLCMGADITVAQGIKHVEPDTVCFSFIGDSTFFHTGIPGVINAVYNHTKITIIVLDNSTTAMTGQQPNPGTGKTAAGEIAQVISIAEILKACGVLHIETVNPTETAAAVEVVKRAADFDGVSAVIMKAPCIAVSKPKPAYRVDESTCINCKKCIRELGCPAIVKDENHVKIDTALCYGCGICSDICPVHAIGGTEK